MVGPWVCWSNNELVVFDAELIFVKYIDYIAAKTARILGFIKRRTKKLNPVTSLLKYNSFIWSPSYTRHVYRIERIQSKFVRFLLFNLRFPCDHILYTSCRFSKLWDTYMSYYGNFYIEVDVRSDLMVKVNFRIIRPTRYQQFSRTNYI